jgi:2-amino-4-hydroxy-6-hydroxymethyldihydropteridine diphosphokinase
MTAMRRVFLGLGSNVGDRWRFLRDAVASLPDLVAVSPVYETDPVGGPAGQGPYLNLVAELSTSLPPRQLLGICHRLETAADRVRHERWGPRTLDIDILLIDGVELDDPDLQIPHPRLRERRFVLEPLRDLAPELVTEDLDRLGRGVRRVGTI